MNNTPELNDFTLTYFPKDRKVVVFSYCNIYQSETNYKIAVILKSIDEKDLTYFVVYLSLKDIVAFPLGTIINNQEKSGEYAGILNYITIDLQSSSKQQKLLFQIPQLVNLFIESEFSIPEKINNFNSKFHVNGQWFYIFKDIESGRNIFIPHYEIARYFYFTSPSMTRQILSASLEEKSSILKGLYKSVEHINFDTKEIVLTTYANSNDAANIYRFAINNYSNEAWHQIRRNLTASANTFKERKEQKGFTSTGNEMRLKVDFPVKEIINIQGRFKELEDGSLLLLKILKEDSSYDFERLFVKIERKNKPDEPIGIVKKEKARKANLSWKITDKTPNNGKESINILDKHEDIEEKIGLDGKEIIRHIVHIEPEDDVSSNNDESKQNELDISSQESDLNGDCNTISGNIQEQDDAENDKKEYLTLQDFKKMLYSCAIENEMFSYNIIDEEALPQKPEEDMKNRHQWKKAKMFDGVTPRNYLAANITYASNNYTIIEIQRDSLVKGLSTLIIWNKDYEFISEEIIYLIVKNFVYENGQWLKNFGTITFERDFLHHPKDENKDGLKDWYKRLIQKIQKR